MPAVPAETGVIIPEEEPMVAIAVLSLDHVPPDAVSLSVVVAPVHKAGVPVIDNGGGLTYTVSLAVVEQPPALAVTL